MDDNQQDSSNTLDDIFSLLAAAKKLEENGDAVEAGTKYYEAVQLMERYLERLPHTPDQEPTRNLLEEKVQQYRRVAKDCMDRNDDDSDEEDPVASVRSPLHNNKDNHNARSPLLNHDSNESALPMAVPLQQAASRRQSVTSSVNKLVRPADMKLGRAIELDEAKQHQAAIALYMEAAELYLKAIKMSEQERRGSQSENVLPNLKGKLEGTLNRVEQLKSPNHSNNNQQQGSKVIARNQKHSAVARSTSSSLSKEEVAVLMRSSTIASGLFMPWSDEEAHQLSMAPKSRTNLWSDKVLLPLADKQKKSFCKWARPMEILQMRGAAKSTATPVMVLGTVSPYNIRQYGVTDCSFIASLCICAAYERRFQKSLISPMVYPQNEAGKMIYNPEGKYMVKLWLNGVARQVVVDDRLPIDRHGNILCAHTQSPPGQLEIYVPIIEKAFLKMAGGYTFPGSNSGVDMYSLTGWIPERILFPKDPNKVRDHETPRERAWERLYSANSFGDCLQTVSSEASLTPEQAEKIGLVTGHAYAVLTVVETSNGTRLLQLKNPWANKGWRGRYSCYDTDGWSDPRLRAEVGYNPDLARKQDDGVFWICWEDVLRYFQNIHLSWNPALFAYQKCRHGFWPKSQGPSDDTFNCGENPQYVLTMSQQAIKKGASLWIQISRHVTKQEQEGSEVKDYLTVHLHRNDKTKERIFYPRTKRNVLTGAYTNNPHGLVRYDITDPADQYISVVLSQYEKSHDLGYTFSCYCTEPFELGLPAKDLPYQRSLASSWTSATAGGPVGKKQFYTNPMFAVSVPAAAVIQVQCSSQKTLAVNVMMVPVDSYGQRPSRIKSEPPVDSGNYRHGFVVTERSRVEAGSYALVVSNYNQGRTGSFLVKINSSVQLRIEELSSAPSMQV